MTTSQAEIIVKQGEHRNSNNDNNNNCYTCTLCNYASDKSANLTRHIRSMHEIVKDSLFCCGLKFQSKADYRDHNKMSHREGHVCTVCMKSFSRRALLKRHQSVHTGIKEFKCDYCPYSSSHKSNVVRHLKIHRDIIGDVGIEKFMPKKRCYQHQSQSQNQYHPEPDSTTMMIPRVTKASSSRKENLSLSDNFKRETRSRTAKNAIQKQNQDEKPKILLQMLSTKMDEEKETKKPKIKHSIDSILRRSSSSSTNSSSSRNEKRIKVENLDTVTEAEIPEQLVSSSTSPGSISGSNQGPNTSITNTSWGEERENRSEQRPEVAEPEHRVLSLLQPFKEEAIRSHTHSMEDANYYACRLRPSSYLPAIDLSGFAGTNWNTPAFPHISPYAFYGLASGFGPVIGFEESRYLSSPLVPSHTETEAPSGILSSLHQSMTSALNQSNESTINNRMATATATTANAMGYRNERDYKSAVFGAGLPPYFFGSSTPELSSHSPNFSLPRPKLQVLPESSAPGVEYSHSSCTGMRLTFTQVSNAQVAHFVSY